MHAAGVAGQLEQVFERDLQHARRVEYADWAKRSLTTRLQEYLILPVRDLL